MLAMIYLSLTAKPISLRRLFCLFIVSLIAADAASVELGAKEPLHAAAAVAATITLAAWSAPLARMMYHSIYCRSRWQSALLEVSGFIQWTYCGVAVLLLSISIAVAFNHAHQLTLGSLLQSLTLAAGIAVWLAMKTR